MAFIGYADTQPVMPNTTDANGNPLAATVADIPSVSRYDVYMWEMRNPTTTIDT